MSNDAQRQRFENAFPNLNLRPSPYLTASGEEEYAVWCAAEAQYEGLVKAVDAIIQQWYTPYWKETGPTAEVIYVLKCELDKLEK
jgi:hypothetical protein